MQPPRLARALLHALLPPDQQGEVDGDLLELFEARTAERGPRHARLRYWHDTFSIIRQRRRIRRFTAPARKGIVMTIALHAVNELRLAARALAKRPGYTAVAVLTLSLGMILGFLIGLVHG